MRDALGEPARVDEDERAVLADQLGEPVVDLLPDLIGRDRLDRRAWHLEPQVHVADVPLVDDLAIGSRAVLSVGAAVAPGAHEEARHVLDRSNGRRQADAHRRHSCRPRSDVLDRDERACAIHAVDVALDAVNDEVLESLESEREMGAALVVGHRVDLVDDHRADGLEHRPAVAGRQQDVEGLGVVT